MTPICKLLTKVLAMAYSMLNLFFDPAKEQQEIRDSLDNGPNAKRVV